MSIMPDGRAARAADLGQGEIREGDDCEDDFHDSIGSQAAEVPRVLSSRINSFPGSSAMRSGAACDEAGLDARQLPKHFRMRAAALSTEEANLAMLPP